MEERTYSIAEASDRLNRSVGWVRGKIRAGLLSPARIKAKHGEQYAFTEADLAQARALLPVRRTTQGTVAEAYSLALRADQVNAAMQQQVADLRAQVAGLEAEREAQREIMQRLEQDRELLRQERDTERQRLEAEQQRVNALLSLSVWDRVRGKHRQI